MNIDETRIDSQILETKKFISSNCNIPFMNMFCTQFVIKKNYAIVQTFIQYKKTRQIIGINVT